MNAVRFIMSAATALTLVLGSSHMSHAEERAPDDPLHTDIDLGAVLTSGNTHTTTLNGAWKTRLERETWRIVLDSRANASSASKTTTAEKYEASLQADRNLNERTWVFARLGFESDRFAGYRRRTSETLGLGRQLTRTDRFEWKIELGGGLRQTLATDHSRKRETIMRAASDMLWKISDTASLAEKLTTEGSGKAWTTKSLTELKTRINAHVSSRIALRLTHNSQVPAGKKKLDTELSAGLSLDF